MTAEWPGLTYRLMFDPGHSAVTQHLQACCSDECDFVREAVETETAKSCDALVQRPTDCATRPRVPVLMPMFI